MCILTLLNIKKEEKMLKKMVLILIISLFVFLLVASAPVPEKKSPNIQPQQQNPIIKLTQSMTERLIKNLHIKKIVGNPVKIGNTTIIPIIMLDIGYGGGGGGPAGGKQMGGGFYLGGEAKPLGFIIITKSETKFVSAGKAPRK
jgi:uncharacterized membrane protein YgcG